MNTISARLQEQISSLENFIKSEKEFGAFMELNSKIVSLEETVRYVININVKSHAELALKLVKRWKEDVDRINN